jgi:hypothetical protein
VANQLINSLHQAVKLERKIKETDELEARLEELEQTAEKKGGSRWGLERRIGRLEAVSRPHISRPERRGRGVSATVIAYGGTGNDDRKVPEHGREVHQREA